MPTDPETIQKTFSVVRLEEGDVSRRSDHFLKLRELVHAHEAMYPEIAEWFAKKVTPGVRESERIAFVGYLNEKPAVSAIVKRGAEAKFCHLHISNELQNLNLGEVFFALMANEVRDLAQTAYFTLPESLWTSKAGFFHSFNFVRMRRADNQYRLFDEELECREEFSAVCEAVAGKIPKLCEMYLPSEASVASNLLMSIQPRHAQRILDGTKRYEIRRKFSTKWLGHKVNIYASGPVMQIVGNAIVRRIIRNSPDRIWNQLGPELGCTRGEFYAYTRDAQEIFALELGDVCPFRIPISRKEVVGILKNSLVPPQSYCVVEKSKVWGKAISIAHFLQGAFRGQILSGIRGEMNEKKDSKFSNTMSFQMRNLLS